MADTDDMDCINRDRFVFLSGRNKNLVVCDCDNISPREVQVLSDSSAVAEAVVVTAPDREWGEEAVAFLALPAGRARLWALAVCQAPGPHS